jgi:hypothetical protein
VGIPAVGIPGEGVFVAVLIAGAVSTAAERTRGRPGRHHLRGFLGIRGRQRLVRGYRGPVVLVGHTAVRPDVSVLFAAAQSRAQSPALGLVGLFLVGLPAAPTSAPGRGLGLLAVIVTVGRGAAVIPVSGVVAVIVVAVGVAAVEPVAAAIPVRRSPAPDALR